MLVVDEASNGEEALVKVAEKKPDVLIIDIRMPVMGGIEAVSRMPKGEGQTRALVLSMHDSEEYVLKSIEAGAYGYLLKDTSKEEFVKAIYTVYEGDKYFSGDISDVLVKKYLENAKTGFSAPTAMKQAPENSDFSLTRREREVLQLAVSGKSNREIAETLSKSVRTIEAHRFNLMKKMGVKNLMELASKAQQYGLV
ncbi:UNVERIFIED_CONTAM: hypothetical protein GTU68_009178 [Idotea baltica]|nr:hypothetical protein [Idotea baltica]